MSRHWTEEQKIKLGAARRGSNNPNWKGEKVGMDGLHWRMRKIVPRPLLCQCCNKVKPIDLANISQKYLEVISDWEWLCRKCHMTKDGRMDNLIRFA